MEKRFSVDARTILTLGRDSIKDHTTALLELVKNSYDADAEKVVIEIYCSIPSRYVRVADNGCGMTEEEVDNYWLRIGYSEKRINKISGLRRRKTGEKGIGRISADRLGAILELITKAEGNRVFGLEINWDDFNREGKDLSSIPIKVLDNPKIRIPKSYGENINSGTELIIRNLRQRWSQTDIENLYDELSILTPPFKEVKDFEIFIKTDAAEGFSGKVKSPFYQTADVELNAEFEGTYISYFIKDRYSSKNEASKERIDWRQFIQKPGIDNPEISESPRFGPLKLTLLFYPREAKSLEGTEFRLGDLRDFLDKNAGVRIYRDNIRVKPYGNPKDPEGDWLGLAERKTREPAGISRSTWRVAANQIVGAVFVSRDNNPNLIDSSSREGLIQGEAFNELRSFVLGCLRLLETYRHRIYVEKESIRERKVSPTEEVRSLEKELMLLKKDLSSMKVQIPRTSQKPIIRTLDQVWAVSEKIKETQKTLGELVSQSRVLRGLATIGIASAVFGHETQSSISEFISATYAASSLLKGNTPKVDLAIDELNKAKKYANQVSAWGAFALARIHRDKRRRTKVDIKKLIEETIKEIEPVFKAVNIFIDRTNLKDTVGRTFGMDVESILLNLMTNAYSACQQVNRERIIAVALQGKTANNINGFELTVADSGPGIDPKFKEMIWQPLFTTKVDREGKEIGTGLGLTIVQSIVEELNGTKKVDTHPKLKGARFTVWIPLA